MTDNDTIEYRTRQLEAARPRLEDDYKPSLKVTSPGGESKWLRITPAEYFRVVEALTTEPGITYRVQAHDITTLTWPMWDACGIECPAMIGADCPGSADGHYMDGPADAAHHAKRCPGKSSKFPNAAAEVVWGWSLHDQPEVVGDSEQPIGWNAIFRPTADDDTDGPMGAGLILSTDSQGFVSLARYETVTELDGIWSMLQDEEAKYLRANCEECTEDERCYAHDDDED